MNDKILTLLGFATKAGKLSYGFDAVKTALAQSKSKLVLIANDLSQKSQKEARRPFLWSFLSFSLSYPPQCLLFEFTWICALRIQL